MQRTISQNSANKSVAFGVLYGSLSQKLIAPTAGTEFKLHRSSTLSIISSRQSHIELAARFAAGTDELAQLVRKDQDLTAEADRLDKSIIAAVSKLPAERNEAREEQIRMRIET